MVPGMINATEERLREFLVQSVTDVREDTLAEAGMTLLTAHDAEAQALGIQFGGGPEVSVVVTDPTKHLGQVRLQPGGRNNTVFFDNRAWSGNFHANIRMAGDESIILFNRIGDAYVALPEVLLRSDRQFLFWGAGSSAVGCSLEIDGIGHGMVVGDDALISGGVWLRNYDMHAMHDLRTGARINRPPLDTVIERHVWLGQDALLLSLPAGRHGRHHRGAVGGEGCRAALRGDGRHARPGGAGGGELGTPSVWHERRGAGLDRAARIARILNGNPPPWHRHAPEYSL